MKITKRKKLIWQHRVPNDNISPLQPLAVALVCVVFVGLILLVGVFDVRRIDKTITDFIENRGISIVSVTQSLAEKNLNKLIKAYQSGNPDSLDATQMRLNETLYDMCRNIDDLWQKKKISNAYLRDFVVDQKLWYAGIINRRNRILFESRPIEKDIAAWKKSGDPNSAPPYMSLATFDAYAASHKIGFIALDRQDKGITVIIALDSDGLQYWGTKVAIKQAIEESGEAQGLGVSYMIIMDQTGRYYDQTGDIPQKWQAEEMPTADIFSGKRAIVSRKVSYLDKTILDMAVPLNMNGKINGLVRLGLDRGNADRLIEENARNVFFMLVSVVIITLLSMWILYRNQKAHLTGIVQMERQLEKAERLSSLGQLAAGVAHEIRNPLNAISMASQRLQRDYAPDNQEKVISFQNLTGVIRDEIRRLNGIIEEFLSFGKSRRLELHDYPISQVIQKILFLLKDEAESLNIVFYTQLPDDTLTIPMDADKLQQALLNIIKNAMESIKGPGSVTISAASDSQNILKISVTDTGCGMTREEVEKIFNPEFTTKEKGLGLGLALAHEIIRGHGGDIRVWSQKDWGTTLEIFLLKTRGTEKTKIDETV